MQLSLLAYLPFFFLMYSVAFFHPDLEYTPRMTRALLRFLNIHTIYSLPSANGSSHVNVPFLLGLLPLTVVVPGVVAFEYIPLSTRVNPTLWAQHMNRHSF